MCGPFPNGTTKGKPAPRMTIWEAIIELFRGGRWYDATKGASRE